MRIHIEERGQDRIATHAEFDRFQAGKQAPLLFVEQAVEQENGRFELIEGDVKGGRVRDQRDDVGRATGPDLIFRPSRLGGGVEEPPRDLGASHTTLAHQLVERIVNVDMQPVGEFIGEPALWRLGDPRLQRRHERPVAREPHRLVGPQTVFIKTSDRSERIEPAPVRVAGEVAEWLEFAEDGEIGGRAQCVFQRRQVGDRVAVQIRAEALGIE